MQANEAIKGLCNYIYNYGQFRKKDAQYENSHAITIITSSNFVI